VLLLIAACTLNPATGERQLTLLSESQEIQIGAQTHPEVLATFGAYDNPDLQRYVQELGRKLASNSERPELDWTFTVLDDPVVNAMALPGGFIYVNRGILAHFNSEAELASVLGHEIGHVTARHSVEQMSRAQLAQLGLGVAAIASPEFRQYAGLASQGIQILFLKFGRDDENQSDELGLRYMMRAGYDPREMPKVFATLDRISSSSGLRSTPEWASTHPDPGNRIANIEAQIAELEPDTLNRTVGRRSYLARLQGLVFGDDPRQGYTIGQVYYHPELAFKITFPDDWRIINQRSAVGALSPQQDAAVVLTLARERTAAEAYDAFFAQQGIQKGPNRGRNFYTFRALDAQTGAPSAQGLIGFLSHGGRVYQLMGYTAVDSYSSYERTMHGSMASFAEVTDRRYLDIDPATVDVVRVPQRMTLAEFNRSFPSTIELEQLALINGLQGDAVIEGGTFLKRVVGGELPER
jgi:predicted Zn-dependent protease